MEEYFDTLDEKVEKTGKSKPRSEVHREGYWYGAVHIWIYVLHPSPKIDDMTLQKEEVAEVKYVDRNFYRSELENNAPNYVRSPEEERIIFDYVDSLFEV